MRIFVTGGTGFVGSHFLGLALAAGHSVTALRRPGARTRIPLVVSPNWLEKSMTDVTAVDFEGCDALVHLAAHSANVPYDTLENCMHWNVEVPMALLSMARLAGVGRFVVAGTCFEYGRAGDRYDFIPTDAPLEPVDTYPRSKAAASVAMLDFARAKELRLSLLRIFQVYGPGEAATRFWPSLHRAAVAGADFPMSPGEQVRDFIRVEDVAGRFLAELSREVPLGRPEIRHVGTGQPQSLRSFAEQWWIDWGATGRLLPGRMPYRPGEIMRLVPRL